MAITDDKLEARKLLRGLNPQQKVAVARTLKTDALIIAGAGSGKTKVLTTRTAYLIARGCPARRILTVTFTNKAAAEMKERISKAIGKSKAKQVTIGTFHSLAVRWLRRWPNEAGLKKNWTIFDTDEQKKLVKTILKNHNQPTDNSVIRATMEKISNCKNDMVGPEQYRNKAVSVTDKHFYNIYRDYQDQLQRNNAVDFDDLIMKIVLLLKNNTEVRKTLQAQFRFIMVDEYQDSNECQYQMLKLLRGTSNNLFAVGDDYQGIYGWRGANIDNIFNFEKDYNAKVIKLEQNYRSKKTIVQAANELMTHNTNQMKKVCFSDHPQGEKIRYYTAETDEEEARFVAQEISNLVKFEGIDYKDVAILYRTNVLSRLIEDHFVYNRIPYNMVSGFSFYERKEIKDILAWIQLSVNPDNDLACERVLGITEGIGKTTITTIVNKAREADKSVYQCVEAYRPKTSKIQAGIDNMLNIVGRLNAIYEAGKQVTDTPISDMLDLVFRYTGYVDKLRSDMSEESTRRIENIQELQKIAAGYEEEAKDPDMQEFLDQVSLVSQQDKVNDDNEVQMMTLHASKGLEFPYVFMIGMEEGLLPHNNSLSVDSLLEEERRLCYVGITRAETQLYMTNARRRMKWDRSYDFNAASRFIENLPKHLVEEI